MLRVNVSHIYPADFQAELSPKGNCLIIPTDKTKPGEKVGFVSTITGNALATGVVVQLLEGAALVKAQEFYV